MPRGWRRHRPPLRGGSGRGWGLPLTTGLASPLLGAPEEPGPVALPPRTLHGPGRPAGIPSSSQGSPHLTGPSQGEHPELLQGQNRAAGRGAGMGDPGLVKSELPPGASPGAPQYSPLGPLPGLKGHLVESSHVKSILSMKLVKTEEIQLEYDKIGDALTWQKTKNKQNSTTTTKKTPKTT